MSEWMVVRRSIRVAVACAVVLAVVLAVTASPVVAQEEEDCLDGCLEDPDNEPPEMDKPNVISDGPPINDKMAATRVRKAFLNAKKAFHEARQNIQAIEKGDKEPTEDVPTFFEDVEEEESGD